jgi:hypothetical protein
MRNLLLIPPYKQVLNVLVLLPEEADWKMEKGSTNIWPLRSGPSTRFPVESPGKSAGAGGTRRRLRLQDLPQAMFLPIGTTQVA